MEEKQLENFEENSIEPRSAREDFYDLYSNGTYKGALMANSTGPTMYVKPNLYFSVSFDDHYNNYFSFKKGRDNDPTFSGEVDRMFRIGGKDGVGIWGNGDQEKNDLPNLYIIKKGKIGVNTTMKEYSSQEINNYDLFVPSGIYANKYGLAPLKDWVSNILKEDYVLRDFSELKNYIKTEKHLPNMFSAKEITEQGYDLHEMNMKLLAKIEELTLYLISQEDKIESLEKRISILEEK